MNTQELYAYFAGAIDADGYITIGRANKKSQRATYYDGRMGYSTVDDPPVVQQALKEAFGASIYSHQPKNPRHRKWWIWYTSGKKALHALRCIEPFLMVKKEQARIVIEFIECKQRQWAEVKTTQKPPYRITDAMESERREYWAAVTRLNNPKNRTVHFL